MAVIIKLSVSGVHVAQPLGLYVEFCRPLFTLCLRVNSFLKVLTQAYHMVTVHYQESRNELTGIIQNGSQIDNKVDVLHRYVVNFQFYHSTDILLKKTIYVSTVVNFLT